MDGGNDLILRPGGILVLHGTGPEYQRLLPFFEAGNGPGLLALLRSDGDPEAGTGYQYFRRIVRDFALHLIRMESVQEDGTVPEDHLSEQETAEMMNLLPETMTGSAEINAGFLQGLYDQWKCSVDREAREKGLTTADCIRSLHPNWKDLGKVTLHLAENKKDTDGTKPFVFLATCQHRISETGQIKHLPLASALKVYASEPKTLLSFLEPLRDASAESDFLKKLLDGSRIFNPSFFTAEEAWGFLRSTEILQEHGIPVRLAGFWQKQPRRLKVAVTLDVRKKRGLLTADSLVKYSVNASIGGLKLTDQEMADILRSKGGLIRVKGEWVEAETDRVRDLLAEWDAARAFSGNTELSFIQALRILSRANGLGNDDVPLLEDDICEVNLSPELADALTVFRDPEKMELPSLPEHIDRILRPYQRTGVKFLWNMLNAGFGVCLADDMGLGKTLQMITCLDLLCTHGALADLPALALVPASLLTNWTEELAKFAPEIRVRNLHPSALSYDDRMALQDDPAGFLKDYDLVLATYAMVPRRDFLHELEFPLILLDEAQQIKNPSSQVSRAVRSLRGIRRVAMTGTPVENSLSDLWSIFDFICPGLLGTPDAFRSFVHSLEEKKPHSDYSPLRKLVRPYILHRLKSDKKIIADLPDKIERTERTPLTAVQAKFYRRAVDMMKHELASADERNRNGVILSYLLQLKQICNHPSQFSGNGDYAPERSGKFMRLGRLADMVAAHGEKMLVFTQFKELTEVLHEFLSEHFGRPGLILHGGIPVGKRADLVRQFQNEQGPPFFVISLKAGGTGLTLTAAAHVVHFDRWWNPAVENQATDRAYRIGQKRSVIVHKLVSPGTIEEKIDALISGKRFLAETLLEKGSVRLLTEMNNDELMNFVRLDMDAVLEDTGEEEYAR